MSECFSTACCKTRTDLLRLEKEIKLPNQNYKQIRITDPKRGENYNHVNNLDQSQHELIKMTQSELKFGAAHSKTHDQRYNFDQSQPELTENKSIRTGSEYV